MARRIARRKRDALRALAPYLVPPRARRPVSQDTLVFDDRWESDWKPRKALDSVALIGQSA